MELDPAVQVTLVASVVSIVVGIISFFSARATIRHEVHQAQFRDILARRIELYPKLWGIHIFYETNWVFENKPKTREWAEEYVSELNKFNLEGGLFFSESLYHKFHQLRSKLYEAIQQTNRGDTVNELLATDIRSIVYGQEGQPGLSTYLKDDLGSYRSTTLQRRIGI